MLHGPSNDLDLLGLIGAEKSGMRVDAYAPKIQAVGIPAGSNDRIVGQFSIRMISAGTEQNIELGGFQMKEVFTQMLKRYGGVSSIPVYKGPYYMMKVLLSMVMASMRSRIIK